MLLAARHEDGSPMTDTELRDELMTLLVAGHETTASELAWAFERLAREPAVLDRLVRRDRRRRRRRVPRPRRSRRRCAGARCSPTPRPAGQEADRDRRLGVPAGRLPDRQRLPRPPRPGHLPRPVRLPARALPRHPAGHLHLDPVRRRAPALHRRELRDARDEDRPARGAVAPTRSSRRRTAPS